MKNVYDRQDKIIENRDKLEELLVHAHVEAKKAWDLEATEAEMKDILMGLRHAQWRWDFAAASHGASFHAPTEIGRIISTGLAIVGGGIIMSFFHSHFDFTTTMNNYLEIFFR